eukprot:10974276-Alexandrium_andersonii.AAC.1
MHTDARRRARIARVRMRNVLWGWGEGRGSSLTWASALRFIPARRGGPPRPDNLTVFRNALNEASALRECARI